MALCLTLKTGESIHANGVDFICRKIGPDSVLVWVRADKSIPIRRLKADETCNAPDNAVITS